MLLHLGEKTLPVLCRSLFSGTEICTPVLLARPTDEPVSDGRPSACPKPQVAQPGTNSCSALLHGAFVWNPSGTALSVARGKGRPSVSTAVLSSRQFYPLHLVIPKVQFSLLSALENTYFSFSLAANDQIYFVKSLKNLQP